MPATHRAEQGNEVSGQFKKSLFAAGAVLASAAALLVPAGAAQASVVSKSATLETGNLSQFDETNAMEAKLSTTTRRAYHSSHAAKALYDGHGINGYSRGVFDTDWQSGDSVWFGGAFYLPKHFKKHMQGEVDLMRWDDWDLDPTHTDRCGLVIYGSDRKGRFQCWRIGIPGTITAKIGPFRIKTGRWNYFKVHQKLSTEDGQARTALWKNGHKVGSNRQANDFGHTTTNIRFGIVATAGSEQRKSLNLLFDGAQVSKQRF
jgi:hypothetical protein